MTNPDIAARLSLSTCWNSHRHTDGYEMLKEIRELGFGRSELSHGIRMDLVPGILKAVAENLIEISSVHNFCPLPTVVTRPAPNLFQPSARSRKERALWLLHSRRTLEFAKRVGAPIAVMHSGSASFRFFDPRETLEAGSAANPDKHAKALKRLRRGSARALERVIVSYRALAPDAERLGVTLVLENREDPLELPLDDGFAELFAGLDPLPCFAAWHDTGHARIKHELGLLDHDSHLASVADRLAGFHLHDVDEQQRDHRPPGTGRVDFAMIARHVRPHHVLVFEPHPSLTPAEIVTSKEFLVGVLGS